MRFVSALLISVAFVASVPASSARPRLSGEARLTQALEGKTAGQPVNCIELRDIHSTEIIDGTAILYHVGRRIYVNRPDSGAATLRRDDVLVTDTHSSQLCSIDTVRLYDSASRFTRGFVGLGRFVPYEAAVRH